ncbi:MAG TPA: glycosyltransferase family 2 protein [Candidatus Cloacimonetes bacterium]|nr:glycosyltransferase family 2 protein [Candidatus Cloacimonadota bacterium]
MKNKLSVVLITKNEESNIERCLKSARFADEIIILDSRSIDRTVNICQNFQCRVYQTEWFGFGLTKKKAVSFAKNNWILSLDADEQITSELREEIDKILQNPEFKAYSIKRISYYLGKKIKYCGWNRDFPVRLFDKNYANFNDKIVHESVVVQGDKGRINQPILHYTYPTIESHLKKMEHYSTLGSQTLLEKNRRSTPLSAFMRGFLKFLKMYFLQLGFLDGIHGFVLCLNSSWGIYLKYLKLWKLNK